LLIAYGDGSPELIEQLSASFESDEALEPGSVLTTIPEEPRLVVRRVLQPPADEPDGLPIAISLTKIGLPRSSAGGFGPSSTSPRRRRA
jgi:hypothetical protein